jgi:hypothetical protein
LTKAAKSYRKAGPHNLFPKEERVGQKLEIGAEKEVKSCTGLIQLGLTGKFSRKAPSNCFLLVRTFAEIPIMSERRF